MLNANDMISNTTLMEAVVRGDIDECRQLLEYGADVNAREPDGRFPLYEAAKRVTERRFPEICKLLLEHGAEVNALVKGGSTPLHAAAGIDRRCWATLYRRGAREGQHEICKLLLKHGAKVNAKDELGDTPPAHGNVGRRARSNLRAFAGAWGGGECGKQERQHSPARCSPSRLYENLEAAAETRRRN